MEIYLNHLGLVSALGSGHEAVLKGLIEGSTAGMAATQAYSPGRSLVCGAVSQALPELGSVPDRFRSRNNRLLLQALHPIRAQVDAAIARYGAHRVGIVLGTSTSGIGEVEEAFLARGGSGPFPQ